MRPIQLLLNDHGTLRHFSGRIFQKVTASADVDPRWCVRKIATAVSLFDDSRFSYLFDDVVA